MMASTHPACCKNPESCTLTYREHLVGVGLSSDATPTRRAVNHIKGLPDEPVSVTKAREKRLERDLPAYKRLRQDGLHPRSVKGSARLEATANSSTMIERGYE
jgi:hypothetical protein